MEKIRKILQPIFFVLTVLFSTQEIYSQTISPRYFGQNAWMPDTVGNAAACQQTPCIVYGSLHNKWGKIGESGAGSVRFGGIQPDRNMPTNYQYIKMIDSIRAKGMEPIIQVPFHNWRYSAAQAAAIVQYVNVTRNRNVKYWIIGNEPDLEYGYTTAAQVAGYMRPFASAMKAVDPSILIIGPETSWYNTNIINGLTTPGGPDDITGTDSYGRYYVDIIAYHQYAYDGSQTRSDMITKLMQTNGYNDRMVALNARLASCNAAHGRTGISALKAAVTEANLNWQNPSTDNLYGLGVNSFIGAQFIAEMFGIGMKNGMDFVNMWSVVEGNTTALNIGYLESNGTKKPAYHHFQMMAQNFKGNYVSAVSTQSNVKAFASQSSSLTTVMIMNEDLTVNHNFTVRLNTAAATGTNSLKVNVNANIAQEYNDVINNQSSILLQFNPSGVLVKKIVYTLAGHAALNLAPTTTTYNAVAQNTVPPSNTTPAANLVKCSGLSTTLTASSGTNTINWYASATSTAVLGTGTSFATPALSASGSQSFVTYYAGNAGAASSASRTAVTVTVNPLPVVSVNSGSVCPGGMFVMSPSGAASYTFSNGSASVSPLVNSSYSVSGTSAAGCISAQSAVANVVVAAPPVISVNSGSICAGSVFTIAPTGASSFSISGGSSTVSPSSTSVYTVVGSNGTGCVSNTVLSTVTVYQRPAVSVNSGSICPGQSFVMMPSGASSYSFSSGSATVNPSQTTSYSVTGISAQGCSSGTAAIAVVNVGTVSSISVNSGSICSGQVFTFTPGGASSYTFSSGSATVSPVTTSTYAISGNGLQGCGVAQAIATVVVHERPVISASNGTVCPGGSFTMNPSGAATYTFSNGSAVVNPTVSTAYQVSGTSAQGCTSANNATVQVTVSNNAAISVNSGTICRGNSFTMSPSGASGYTFSSGSAIVSPNNTTTYTVTGSNGSGCTGTAISTVVVVAPGQLQLTMSGGRICNGGSFTLSPEGADSYTFSSGTNVVRPEVTSSYTVLGKKNNGCNSTGSVVAQVVVNALPVVSAKGGSICAGQQFSIEASGAKNYTYSSGSSLVKPAETSTYSVIGRDANGCVSIPANIKVEVAASPVIVATASSSMICAGSSATLYAQGADSFNWSGGEQNAAIIVSPAKTQTYTVNGWAANGCFASASVVLQVENCNGVSAEENAADQLKLYPNPNNGEFTLELGENSEVNVFSLSGVMLKKFSGSMGNNNVSISDLPTGIYIVKVRQGERTQSVKVMKQ